MPDKKRTRKLSNLLTISQVARILNVTTTTLRRWDEADILKAIRIGPRGDRRYNKGEILDILRNGLPLEDEKRI